MGKNVILLALMFIYRLKKFNPSVSGKRGSEFRLLTVALMLGNKFLDDNTYTNKTWAEVSGISVTEIHIMEVEFLSNMRYELYASESEWAEWKRKLGKLGAFYEKAAKLPFVDEVTSAHPRTPLTQALPEKFPSPPSTHHSSSLFQSPNGPRNGYSHLPNPFASVPHMPHSPLRQERMPSVAQIERKRSLDSDSLPPAKRVQYSTSTISNPTEWGFLNGFSGPAASNVNTTSALAMSAGMAPVTSIAPHLPMPRIQTMHGNVGTQLPPMVMPAANRAMSTVYPSTTASWSQPVTPISALPPNLYQNPIPNLGDGTRTHGSTRTSPTGSTYGPVTPSRQGLSPSYFLTDRSSPYRPVRHVSTLLIPPPSAAMQNTVRAVPHDHMHYQPLGKTASERRTGTLPYPQHDQWQQSHASTPVPQQQYQYRI